MLALQAPQCLVCGDAKRELLPDGSTVPCSACWEPIIAAQRVAKLWDADNLPNYARMSFETFHNRPHEHLKATDLASLAHAKLAAVAFADNPAGFIVFTGPNGCGKTHLAAAIANHVVRTHSAIFLRVIDFLDYLRQAFDPSAGVSFAERFDAAKRVDLLVLDDLGAEHSTPWVNERLFSLLDDRYVCGRPTVITSNVDVGKMQPRVASRLRDTAVCQVLTMQAPDMRPVRNKYATLL